MGDACPSEVPFHSEVPLRVALWLDVGAVGGKRARECSLGAWGPALEAGWPPSTRSGSYIALGQQELWLILQVESSQAFTWQSQLRHRWDEEKRHCFANICDAQIQYSYEYLGNTPRLVITPLTDR
ncbi:hypothetical protein P7K49_011934 [Saguinus oedipus]|uniref:Uncharacterized protein n=1 Tax=Saguinus oedipus TaxID=9490 RepID=A0ABQ9VS27_SAGOE|nr:hypothetical protein P7K49_011934 [Saguinus oedipus]